ncbi:MAG TPA: rhodanese-like domain-containing protein, partial [Chitinophagaceae bacterium]|nr:rhodanese-like domain-containing protein [Chitinophagaceae bacterium]
SSCYLLRNEKGKSVALFTGDTLFIGDVGRPDLAQKVKADLTPEKLAGYLYDSLREKIMPLPDDIVVYPAHGAGSACGKKMSSETIDTLGHQKAVNYALNPRLNKAAFVKEVLSGLMPPPGYFPANVMMNIKGYEQITEVIHRGTQALSAEAFEAAANETGALIIDTRDASQFAKSFIPNSINIGLDGSFAPWVGTLLPDIRQPILFVCDEGREEEVVTRLARVGYDNAIGYLKGGMAAWEKAGKETDHIQSVEAGRLAEILKQQPETAILDVRRQSEYDSEHIVSAINAPLDYLNESMLLLDKQKTYYVHCAGGYRSMIFISALRARGYKHLINVEGGMNEIKAVNQFSLTDYVQPRSLL